MPGLLSRRCVYLAVRRAPLVRVRQRPVNRSHNLIGCCEGRRHTFRQWRAITRPWRAQTRRKHPQSPTSPRLHPGLSSAHPPGCLAAPPGSAPPTGRAPTRWMDFRRAAAVQIRSANPRCRHRWLVMMAAIAAIFFLTDEQMRRPRTAVSPSLSLTHPSRARRGHDGFQEGWSRVFASQFA
jgi:hypothetical protein